MDRAAAGGRSGSSWHWSRVSRSLALLVVLLLVLDVGALARSGPGTPRPGPPARPGPVAHPSPVARPAGTLGRGFPDGVGVIGPYTPAELAVMRADGVSQTLLELDWSEAEPSQGVFDEQYLAAEAAQAASWRADGFQVALNTDLYEAPAWLMAEPGARYVDQHGASYDAEPLPNLVFDLALRSQAQTYLDAVFAALGTDFSFVRAGGGHFGELGYPFLEGSTPGTVQPLYWAFDAAAQAVTPVPGWKPGMASPDGQADRFLRWYFASLVAYQNWQVDALRHAGFAGWVAMLYPSYGLPSGQAQAAIADDLDGASPGEVSGEVQRGYDWAGEISGLDDTKVIVYGTEGETTSTLAELSRLALAKGLPVMAENTGGNSDAQLAGALAAGRELGLQAFFLVRADTVVSTGQLGRLAGR